MPTKYEVRQLVKTVKGQSLQVVSDRVIERMAISDYETFSRQNPDDYFELVKIEHYETCLKFTPVVKEPTP